jgi:hypothetical protein
MNPLVDLDLTNYRRHPTRKDYVVFRFKDHQQGEYFGELLDEEGMEYERTITDNELRMMLFAVKRKDLKRAEALNNKVSARFRSRFIPQKGLRAFTIGIFLFLVLLALLGFFLSE